LFDHYKNEITDFIYESALSYGLTTNSLRTIKVNYCKLYHRSNNIDFFTVSFAYKSNGNVFLLEFNPATSRLEITLDAFNSHQLILNLKLKDDFSQLTFDVLSTHTFESFCFTASSPIEKSFFKAVHFVHNNELCEITTGQVCNYNIIKLESKMGKLEKLFVDDALQLYNKKQYISYQGNAFSNTKIRTTETLISFISSIASEFIYCEVESCGMTDNKISITTNGKEFIANDINSDKFQPILNSESRTTIYEISGYDLILTLLEEVMEVAKPVKNL
jgi:hypothetical protein